MTDSIQRTSSLPLPRFQTETGTHDPLPVDAPKQLNRLHEAARKSDEEKQDDQFEAYLNQGGVLILSKGGEGSGFDTADHIAKNSIYSSPDGKTQF